MRPALFVLAFLAACKGDQGITAANADPVAHITAPSSGELVPEGAYQLRGTAEDPDDARDTLRATWLLGDTPVCEDVAPEADGTVLCAATLTPGSTVVRLEVTDPRGASNAAEVVINVQATDAPQVQLFEPTGDQHVADEPLEFIGSLDDDQDAPDDLVLEWTDDVLGAITVDATVDGDGTVHGTALLPAGPHRVTLTATDSDNKTGQASISFDVDGRPTAPVARIDPGDPDTLDDLVVSFTTDPTDPDGDALTTTIRWDVDGVDSGLTGFVLPSGETERGQRWTATIVVDDGIAEAPAVQVYRDIGNAEPHLDQAILTPVPLTAGDTATCGWSGFSDPDRDSDQSYSDFLVNGTTPYPGPTLRGAFVRGDTVLCEAVAFDGSAYGNVMQTTTVVENSPPELTAMSIAPNPAQAGDTLICTPTSTADADGDPVSVSVAWTVNGTAAGTGNSLSSGFANGDRVECIGTPNDGFDDGASASAQMTIGNTVPTVASVAITPDPARAADTLSCGYSGFADADGDADQSELRWTINGVDAGTGTQLAGGFVVNDEVVCTVTPFDGIDRGPAAADTLVIANTPPVVTSVTLDPIDATGDDPLTCTPGAITDDDGGSGFTTTFMWTVNGSAISATTATLDPSRFEHGDTVFCTVTANDGSDDSLPVDSNVVTIANQAPQASSVHITPDPAFPADVLTCAWSWSDPDGDTDQSTVEWLVNGVSVGSGTSLSSGFDSTDDVECVVTPFDGIDSGAVVSTSIVIGNHAPTVSVGLSPVSPHTDDVLTATPVTGDADGHSVSVSYAWTVDGVSAGTAATLAASASAKGELVEVTVTADDGFDTSQASASVRILNSLPTAPAVAVSPDEPIEGLDDLQCDVVADATDLDGDALTYVIRWDVDGSQYGDWAVSTPNVPAVNTVAREVWTCTAVADDGEVEGPGGSAAVQVVGVPVEYVHVQYPCSYDGANSFILAPGAQGTVYGVTYLAGVTNLIGQGSGVEAEVGIGPDGSDPATASGWTWVAGSYNTDKDAFTSGDHRNDEYAGVITAPNAPGHYDFAFRFTTDGGLTWVYGDLGSSFGADACDGFGGSADGWSAATAGDLLVQ